MSDPNATLKERAVLMALHIGLPGEARQDSDLTEQVKGEHKLGERSGRWVKSLYPPEALKKVKEMDNKARAFHNAVTLPFDTGIGILPGPLIMEYRDRMQDFAGKRQVVRDEFLSQGERWIEWAMKNHNGTFDHELYPGCIPLDQVPESERAALIMVGNTPSTSEQKYAFNPEVFRSVMAPRFTFGTEPIPVPDACHFESTVASLLGTDVDSVNRRVIDATKEAQRELLRRMMEPLKAMATKFTEEPKVGKDGAPKEDIIFRDSLVTNLVDIVKLAPKLNITGDPSIDAFVAEMALLIPGCSDDDACAKYAKSLRNSKEVRARLANEAAKTLQRLAGYSL